MNVKIRERDYEEGKGGFGLVRRLMGKMGCRIEVNRLKLKGGLMRRFWKKRWGM